jgi:cobalt-zinc-cadmium efflux system protein
MTGTHDHAAHGHGGSLDGSGTRRRLIVTLALVSTYMVAEVIGGLMSNSLALLADAGHMLSDAGAIALALFAIWFARRPASPRHTYGYYRAEILAALANAGSLVAIAIYIFVEAYQRFRTPLEVQGGIMMGVAAGGLVVNLIGLWTLHGGRKESLNVRGAWLHVLSDALGSVQAILAGALILAFGWWWVDPAASVLIGLLVIHSSWALMRESVAVLMEGAPGNLDVDAVRNRLMACPGVQEVRDLHVWTITSGLVALSAHIVAERPSADVLHALRHDLEERFGIRHTTIQFDPPDEAKGTHPQPV